jgi:hypothetical protein
VQLKFKKDSKSESKYCEFQKKINNAVEIFFCDVLPYIIYGILQDRLRSRRSNIGPIFDETGCNVFLQLEKLFFYCLQMSFDRNQSAIVELNRFHYST